MSKTLKKHTLLFFVSIGILFIDGCRKNFSATAEHKASYGWEMYELKDYLKSREWFFNSVETDKKWKDGYNGLGWSYAKLLEMDSLDTENIGSIRTFHRGLLQPKDPWNSTDVHLEILAGLTFAYHAKGNDKEAVKFGNALIDSTLIGLNPSRWHSWAFSHDSTLNYLDLRITMASSYFALAEFDSTQVHLKVVLDSLGSSTKLISDYKSLLGRQLVAQQLDSLQKVLQK
tara:strand:+ start:1422 stop:2111 length:690 start_codon:yes stop_codon:yes gene_type:complete